MLIKRPDDIRSSEITPEDAFINRRRFIGTTGLLGVGAAIGLSSSLAGCAPKDGGASDSTKGSALDTAPVPPPSRAEITAYDDATGYNNYYEFGTDKEDPKKHAGALHTQPWTVSVEGLVKKPARYAIDDLFKGMTASERVYRHRCVEAWSMVIPWLGYPLGEVLARLEPLPSAKFVEFTTLSDATQMPGQQINVLQWPYTEALRIDEAMHPLAMLVTGMYGKPAPNQNGAPLRLIVPWKYGFKGGKAIVRIRLLDKQPQTTWNISAPNEYGFYANVNPTVDHPRWSQAKERRVGEFGRRATLMFNGYADQVASLYGGMDLRANY